MEDAAGLTSSGGKPFGVLCLDGGGMRGIYTAAFLDRLLDQYRRIREEGYLDLGAGFDLIAGTSTGAIIACAAAIGRPMSDIVKLYREWGDKIFPERITESKGNLVSRIINGGNVVRAGDAALRQALKLELGDNWRLPNTVKALPAVPVHSHGTDRKRARTPRRRRADQREGSPHRTQCAQPCSSSAA